MEVLGVIGAVIGGIFFLIFMMKYLIIKSRKNEISDWKIGDVVIFSEKIWVRNDLGVTSAVIKGWDLDNVFISVDGIVQKVDYGYVKLNKSAVWRRHYQSCEQVMGVKPAFNPVVNNGEVVSLKYNGKPIETLTETECQIYLKECLAREDYETATLIRKQMEKYR